MRLLFALPALSLVGLLVCSCGGGNAASQLAKAPDYTPKDQTKCGVEKSQAKPLIVEWPSADRGELETQAHEHGLVVVRYQGCEMQVLDGCTVAVKYGYSPMTRKKDRVVMRDADDLYANIPVGAAKLEARLEKSGELDVDMTLVGRWEAERRAVRLDELQGACDGATHVVSALTVGAFIFTAGADATVGGGAAVMGAGGGATSTSKRETLNSDGDEGACEKSTPDDKAPPPNCGAMLRVEVVPLGAAKEQAPTCPDGTRWDGSECVGKKVVTQVECPAGTKWDGTRCVATVSTDCASGQHFEAGRGCVPDRAASGPKCRPLDGDDCEAKCHAGDAASCTQLGILLSRGSGQWHGQSTPRDPARGLPLEQTGCDGGDMLGCLNMGHIFRTGEGAPVDKARALTFFDRVCGAGWGAGCQWASMTTTDAQAASRYRQRADELKQSLPWEPTTH